jgi:DNA topoisomerase-1
VTNQNLEQIKGLKYQKWRIKQMILDVDPKMKKKKGADWFELDEELTEEWVKEHQAFLIEEQRSKIERKFQKENEKLVQEGKKEMKAKELEERLETVHELEKKFKKENKTKKVDAEGKGPTVERFESNLEKLDQRIENMLVQAEDRESNKEVALGTSKIVSIRKFDHGWFANRNLRITSTLASLLSLLRSLMYQSKGSFQSPCAKSSGGQSSQWRM